MVPCQFNDGKPVRTKHHREWDRQVQKITGGLTILPPGRGKWVDENGDEYFERMIPVQIIATDEQIKEIANRTAKHYNQIAVMYYHLSNEAFIIRNKEYKDDSGNNR